MRPADPQASIIISSYNYAAWLPCAIESALNQTYSNVQVVVVDDGSTDGSADVIRSYGDRVVAVFKSNGGMASAWNAGFARATGGAVLFLDADDLLAPDALSSAVPWLRQPAVVKVHWPVALANGDGRPTGGLMPGRDLPEGSMTATVLANGPEAIASSPIHGNLWSRRFLEIVFPLPETEFRQHSDMYLMTLAPLYGSFARLHEPHSFYRVHGRNDYAASSSAEKNSRNLRLYRTRCELQANAARALGLEASRDAWLAGNPRYDWMVHFDRAAAQLMDSVPQGSRLVLIDDTQCADGVTNKVLPGRTVVRLMERNGQPDGLPAGDEAAIAELQRLRAEGVRFLAVMWCSFWWLEHYADLFVHLTRTSRVIARSDDVVVYAL